MSDDDFLKLYDQAVVSELSNMQELREDAAAFPIEDMGVAQGNSLSPLLGNLLLRNFDASMNDLPGIRCIRYIDDFILLGPSKYATMQAFSRAESLLAKWGMTLALDKTEQGSAQQCFNFLGIEFNNGFIRPSTAARVRFLTSIKTLLKAAEKALIQYRSSNVIEKRAALLKTIVTVSETMNGWGMHYRFCNDSRCLRKIDEEVAIMMDDYFATYRSVRNAIGSSSTWDLLGIQSLEKLERKSFAWPKKNAAAAS